jgi:hypothetical protein
MQPDIKQSIADEALKIVTGARRAAYGSPERNFERIKLLQGAYLGIRAGGHAAPLTELDVAMLNLLQKIARIAESPDHRDSYVDIVGYTLCGAEVAGVAMPNTGLSGGAPEAEPPKLQLEAGKFYRTRNGRKVGPAEPLDDPDFRWAASSFAYTPEGSNRFQGQSDSPHDIVAEWSEPASTEPII